MESRYNLFLNIDGGAYYNNALWCMSSKENKLYRIDTNTGVVEYILSFDKIENKSRLIFKIIEYKGKLILIPGYAKYFIVYNILNEEIEYFKYRYFEGADSFYKFAGYLKIENNLFLFPGFLRYMLKINLDNMEFQYIDNPTKVFEQIYGKKEKYIYSMRGSNEGKEIYVPCYMKNAYIRMNSDNNICELIQIEGCKEEKQGFIDMLACDNELIFLDHKGNLISWNVAEKKSKILFSSKGRYFSHMEKYGENIYLIPGDVKNICIYNRVSNSIQEIEYPTGHKFRKDYTYGIYTFNDINKINDKIFITPRCNNMLLVISLMEKEVKGISLSTGKKLKEFCLEKLKKEIDKKEKISELDYGLEEYMSQIKKQDNIIIENSNNGRTIYNLIR